MAKILHNSIHTFISIFYEEYGAEWCSSQLSIEPKRVISIANKLGLVHKGTMTFRDIGKILGISHTMAKRDYDSAMSKIKEMCYA